MSYGSIYPQPNAHSTEGPLHNVEYIQVYPPTNNNPTFTPPITHVPLRETPYDSHTTLLDKDPPILPPNITMILLFGLVLLFTWLCVICFNTYVYDTINILEYCPLTYIAVVHGVALLILLPGLAFSKKMENENKKNYFFPWAFVGELFFVGYFCLFMLTTRQTLPLVFCTQPFFISLYTWSQERIDIIGGVAVIALMASSFMLMTTSYNWQSTPFYSVLFTLGMPTLFSLYIILSRKSTSNPTTGNLQVLLIHITFGFILSLAAALGLEVFFDHSKWLGFFGNWGVDMIWKMGLFVVIGIVYKVSVVLTLRYSNIHITGYAIQLGLVLGAATSNKDLTPNSSFLDWIQRHPLLITGYCLLACCCLYWFARILGLRLIKKSDSDGVPLERYSLNPT